MPEIDPNEFTDREKYLLSYYRAQISNRRQLLGPEVVVMVGSVVCMIAAVIREEVPLGLVAYAMLLGRVFYFTAEGGKWTKDFRSIIRKYDARLEAMSEKAESK